jgi:hypothetical protein
MIEIGRRIGQAGWTLPMDATPRETEELVRDAEADELDAVFVRYYDSGVYDGLKASLKAKASLDRWRGLLEQSCSRTSQSPFERESSIMATTDCTGSAAVVGRLAPMPARRARSREELAEIVYSECRHWVVQIKHEIREQRLRT